MSFRIDFNSLVNDFPDARSRETNGQRRGIFSLLFFFSRCNSEHERLSEELIVICEGGGSMNAVYAAAWTTRGR